MNCRHLICSKRGILFIGDFFTAYSSHHDLEMDESCEINKISICYKWPLLHKYYLMSRKVEVLVLLDNFPDLLCTKRKPRSGNYSSSISGKPTRRYRMKESLSQASNLHLWQEEKTQARAHMHTHRKICQVNSSG